MSNKYIENINYNRKEYFVNEKPLLINNLLLAEDWNKIQVIEQVSSEICGLAWVIEQATEQTSLSDHLLNVCNDIFPIGTYVSTIDNLTGDLSGIGTIKMNNQTLYGPLDEYFLLVGTLLVSSFNGENGDVFCISAIELVDPVGYDTSPSSWSVNTSLTANMGDYFKLSDKCVSSVNGGITGTVLGDVELISSLEINATEPIYTMPQAVFEIKIDLRWKETAFSTVVTYDSATVPTPTNVTSSSIVNIEMFDQYYKISAAIAANTPLTLNNVVDWICISDENYNVIKPTTATLVNGTLTITSPSAGIIYYVSEIVT